MKRTTKRITITIDQKVVDKIEYTKQSVRIRSTSSMICRLLEEALEAYEDPLEPRLIT